MSTPFYPMTHDDALRLIEVLQALNPGQASDLKAGMMGPADYLANGMIKEATEALEGLMSAADKVKLNACEIAAPHNYAYDGRNLKEVFSTAAEFAAALRLGDFSKIRPGDYWPLTLSGTIHDYATNTDKTLSNAVFKLEVCINPYWKYGDSGSLTNGIPHLLLVSRDLLPWNLQFRSANTTWYDSSSDNPWLGSHLYQTMNNESNGLIKLIKASELGPYLYTGPNGKGMRHLMETKGSTATSASGWGWKDRGILFLPHEKEVWGNTTWAERTYCDGVTGGALQWPIFAGSRRHIVKGLGDGGSRNSWWCECSEAGSSSGICRTDYTGNPSGSYAADPWIGVVLCFLIA